MSTRKQTTITAIILGLSTITPAAAYYHKTHQPNEFAQMRKEVNSKMVTVHGKVLFPETGEDDGQIAFNDPRDHNAIGIGTGTHQIAAVDDTGTIVATSSLDPKTKYPIVILKKQISKNKLQILTCVTNSPTINNNGVYADEDITTQCYRPDIKVNTYTNSNNEDVNDNIVINIKNNQQFLAGMDLSNDQLTFTKLPSIPFDEKVWKQ